MFDWAEALQAAVTICDRDFTIIYMNATSRATFGGKDKSLLGGNLLDCHKPASIEIMKRLLATGGTNTYTVLKGGVKKIIWQSVWREDGRIAGLVEISIPLPADMPHYDRDAEAARAISSAGERTQ